VFFNSPSLGHALAHLQAMAGLGAGDGRAVHAGLYLDPLVVTVLIAAAIGSTPWLRAIGAWRERLGARAVLDGTLEIAGLAALGVVFTLSASMLAAGTFNPFIYFRF
jgi:alginate O-acetyltransferase complex protein AlgI